MVSSVYVPTKTLEMGGVQGAWEDALRQIEVLKEEVEDMTEVTLIRTGKDLKRAMKSGQIGILIYMEGLDCIGEEPDRIQTLYELGVRGASLTWSRKNALATGCCLAGEKKQISGGLTEKGREAVRELERLFMFLDVSHLNDDGFEDVKKIAKKPFCATHSCARSVYDNYRNLTDEQMKCLSDRGGVMGLNGCKYIAGSLSGNHLEMLCAHAEYEMETAGAEHVGFGFDLCDSYDAARWKLECRQGLPERADCFLHHGQLPLLTAALLQRGMQEEKVSGIMGGNFIRYFEEVLP